MVARTRGRPLAPVPGAFLGQGLAIEEERLFVAAEIVHVRAYARYSGFYVGAAMLTKDGETFAACNVENVSFPVGTCAERNALAAAISAKGPKVEIVAMALVASNLGRAAPCSPCGCCRQALLELAPKATILFRDTDLTIIRRTPGELLPGGFSFAAGA
jgi:cytidine deaminase